MEKGEEIYRLASSKYTPYKNKKVNLFKPSKISREVAFELSGINIRNYYHQIDNYAMQHALEKHSKDPVPLMIEDFKKVPTILRDADRVVQSKNTKHGLFAIQYVKTYFGITYFYIAEIRKGRKTVNMKTMYKSKETPSGASYV